MIFLRRGRGDFEPAAASFALRVGIEREAEGFETGAGAGFAGEAERGVVGAEGFETEMRGTGAFLNSMVLRGRVAFGARRETPRFFAGLWGATPVLRAPTVRLRR